MSGQKTPNENRILQGDSARVLTTLPDGSVHCIVTSPPYYQQRDYSTQIQIGNEETPEEYVSALKQVFRECWRVLRPDGTLWLNLGDKYQDGNLLGLPWRAELCVLAGSPQNGVVLDPFVGSGTTAVVAQRLGRKYIGIDSNSEYCAITN
ncbi:MAG: site-specific DNA-methyltransferase [Chloroflexi bacterium]|nr:site-specific DNA-methyltransferase [Chloroflexota bacterium]